MENNKILITYASMSGSTQEIAEFVASELKHLGQTVELRPCHEVDHLRDYSAIVIGASIYMFHMHKDALRFLQRYHKNLAKLPVAIFAGGPYGPNAAQDSVEIQKKLLEELAKYTWLKPYSVQLVGGRFDSARLRFPYNLIPALKQAPPSDVRDWDEIRTWVHSLPEMLLFDQQPESV